VIIDHRIVHWDIIDKPINPKHVPTVSVASAITEFTITSGNFAGFIYGYGGSTGSIVDSSIAFAGGQEATVYNMIWGTGETLDFGVIDGVDPILDTDLSAFKQLVILQGITEVVVLERSTAVITQANGLTDWIWSGITVNPLEEGVVYTIELRR
jgi:hypothetical protein